MDGTSWTDQIVGERMQVDQQFTAEVHASRFSNQEWNLIMTATEFEIEHPDDPERARIVANTDKVPHILPELQNLRSQMGSMGGGGDTADGSSSRQSGGMIGSIKRAFGFGESSGGVSTEERNAAEQLTQQYAAALQEQLESNGRWETLCERVASETDES